MPQSRSRKEQRSLQSLLETIQKKGGTRNPNAIITPDAESELSPQSIPDPKELAQDIKSVVDAVGGKGKTDDLLDEAGDIGKLVKGLFL